MWEATRALLASTRLADFLRELERAPPAEGPADRPARPRGGLLTLAADRPAGAALEELAALGVLSAPVLDRGEYAGSFSADDFLGALLDAAGPDARPDAAALAARAPALCARRVGGLAHASAAFFRGGGGASVLDVVLDGFRAGHHRCVIYEIVCGEPTPDGPIPTWRAAGVVSQVDVARLLAGRPQLAAADAGWARSLAALGLVQGAGAVARAPAALPTLAAFARLRASGASSLAVTDGDAPGAPLVAALGAADLEGLTEATFAALALPVGAYLLLVHRAHAGGGPPGAPGEVLTWEAAAAGRFPPAVAEGRWAEALAALAPARCAPETPLGDALLVMVRAGAHRVFVVDGAGAACGVVSVGDVLKTVSAGGGG
jgi:CBS domain-containing protein